MKSGIYMEMLSFSPQDENTFYQCRSPNLFERKG